MKLGRPKGKAGKLKLTKKDAQIRHLLKNGTSISAIARKMKVSRTTATKYIKEMGVA
ncbi:MAG: helix-turn-helix domain-containing protein [Bacteroidales bacterium]|nr:helix-turn-helix domain-containing protein [Bacteroidales bacterium]